MGYNLRGRAPSSPAGKEFDASVWTWHPLRALCERVSQAYALGLDLRKWKFNGEEGLNDADSRQLALALQAWLESDWPKGAQVLELECEGGGVEQAVLQAFRGAGFMIAPGSGAYKLHLEKVLEFVKFLQHSGGFDIW